MALEIYIDEPIGQGFFEEGVTAKAIRKQIVDAGTVDEINVYINSPGGDVFDATTIYNILKEYPAPVNVFVQGIAASAASIIAMAGDVVNMAANSMLMIHSPMSFSFGNAMEMRKAAARLEKIQSAVIESYIAKSGQTKETLMNWMTEETWLTAQETIDRGFADKITGAVEVKNKFDLSIFNKVPKEIDNIVYNFVSSTPKFVRFDKKGDGLSINPILNIVKEEKPVPELENKEKEELLALRKEKVEMAYVTAKLTALAPFQAAVMAGKLPPVLFDKIKASLEGQKTDFEAIGKLMIPTELVLEVSQTTVKLPQGEQGKDQAEKIPEGRGDEVIVALTRKYMAEHNTKDYQAAFNQVAVLHPEALDSYLAPIRKEEKTEGRYF